MQVGEQEVPLAKARELPWLRLLHLDDHLGGVEDRIGVGKDIRAGAGEIVVTNRAAGAGARLHDDAVPGRHELPNTFRRRGHPVLAVFDFLRDADDHAMFPPEEEAYPRAAIGFTSRELAAPRAGCRPRW